MRFLSRAFALTLALFVCAGVSAQGLTLIGGVALPNGDFGDDNGRDAGYASIGFGGGIEYAFSLGAGVDGLVGTVSAYLIGNGADEELFYNEGADADAGFYFNVPLLGGVKYGIPISPTATLFGHGYLGFNVGRSPTADADNSEVEAATVTTLGLGAAAGIILNNRIELGARFFNFGNQEYEIDFSEGDAEGELERETSGGVIMLTAGIKLQ